TGRCAMSTGWRCGAPAWWRGAAVGRRRPSGAFASTSPRRSCAASPARSSAIRCRDAASDASSQAIAKRLPRHRGWASPLRVPAHSTTEGVSMSSYSMLINGRSVTTPEQDDVINPARGEAFATCPRGSKAHVDEAVAAAADAFKTWKKDEAFRRTKLTECAAAIQGRVQDIATVLSQEQGKPVRAAMAETFGASLWFSYYANLQIEPEVLQDDGEKRIEVIRKPLGVVAAITPWNFPVILLAWKLAPAWLAGNTVVAKPSPYTPLTSLM